MRISDWSADVCSSYLQLPEGLEGVSPAFIEALYARYADDAGSVDPSWRQFFEGLDQARSGPSWARPNWPLTSTDGLTAAMDPTQMAIEPRPDAKAGRPTSTPAVAPAAVPSAGGAADIRQIGRAHV